MQEDDAVGEGFGGEEFEADGVMARLNVRFFLFASPALAGWANVYGAYGAF